VITAVTCKRVGNVGKKKHNKTKYLLVHMHLVVPRLHREFTQPERNIWHPKHCCSYLQ